MPERRNAWRQEYCGKAACRRASKAKSQRRWLGKPENRDYFRGPDNSARVKEWRATRPGYWRKEGALQEVFVGQPIDDNSEAGDFVAAKSSPVQEVLPLQEVIANQPLVLIGLIAQFTGATLQEDIASASRHLLRLGQDVMQGKKYGEESPMS